MDEGKGERYLASGRQYGNTLLGVCHQEEECTETGPTLQKVVHLTGYAQVGLSEPSNVTIISKQKCCAVYLQLTAYAAQ